MLQHFESTFISFYYLTLIRTVPSKEEDIINSLIIARFEYVISIQSSMNFLLLYHSLRLPSMAPDLELWVSCGHSFIVSFSGLLIDSWVALILTM